MGYEPSDSGRPCWYEYGSPDVTAAGRFYGAVLGWDVADAGGEGFEYHIASVEKNGVAGLMSTADQQGSPGANWVMYLEVADVDATAQAVTAAGGTVLKPPANIPGTGRFAVAADPQGAVFGLLRPNPMDAELPAGAFDQERSGHAHWHELSTSDPAAAFDFYSRIFGWERTGEMDMGEHGTYTMFKAPTADLGGMMPLNGAPQPSWRVYFGVDSAKRAVERVTQAGGTLEHGPTEVPGGAWVAMFADDQGARFGVSGPQD